MAFLLYHDMLDDEGDDGDDSWKFSHRLVKHLAPKVKANLRTKESMRQGCLNILLYIAKSLRAKILRTTHNILLMQRDEDERPSCSRTFLQRDGTVHALLQV